MNVEANKLPSWAMALIIILFLIGTAIAIWGFISAFKSSSKKNTLSSNNIWNQLLSDKEYMKLDDTIVFEKGIYALTFINVDKRDYFLPIYVFGSDNFKDSLNDIIIDIDNKQMNNISDYMSQFNKTKKEMIIIKLEETNNVILKEEWIDKLNSKKRGFNL